MSQERRDRTAQLVLAAIVAKPVLFGSNPTAEHAAEVALSWANELERAIEEEFING